MSRRAAVAVVALVAVGAGVLFVGGSVPSVAPGGGGEPTATDGSSSGTAPATTTRAGAGPGSDGGNGTEGDGDSATPSEGSASATADGETTGAGPGYAFTIERIEDCGNTCRDVTARLANTGATRRENVRVATKVYADGELLWSGNETVGTLAPDESHTSTRRVDVGFSGGLQISANDGWVTIVTVVRSDGETVRFEDRRKVA